MRRIILVTMLLSTPAMAETAPQPVTLSGQEYAAIIQALAQRDPVIAALMQKQVEAQQEAAKEAVAAKTAAVKAAAPK